ncbi:MAG: ABC transporter ATP-binding protein [Alphaproteobacteria bacterium]|nr:ABC transporter ATP-binding protein [Alphaproteobacteria bacterium]
MARLPDTPKSRPGLHFARWLWRAYFRQHLAIIIVASVFMVIEGSSLGAISYMVRPMFDTVFVSGNVEAIIWVGAIIFGVFLARSITGFGQRVLMAYVGLKASAQMQVDLVRHLMKLDSVFFQDNAPGALIERVRGDTQAIQAAWSIAVASLGRDIISLITLLAVAASIDWIWTVIALASIPILVFPVVILQKIIHKSTQKARVAAALISTRLDEIFHGMNQIKLNTLEDQQDKRFAKTLDGFLRAQIKSQAGSAGVPALMDIVAGLGFFGVLVYGGIQIMDGQKTIGEFMSFFTAMALIFEPLRRLGNTTGLWQAAKASLERLYAIFEEKPGILSPAKPVANSNKLGHGDIRLSDVSFSYGDQPVLDQISFVAEAGKTTALVGASGAGKSTVFNVLTRLIEPTTGDVSVGGVTVSSLNLADLRGLFSVVSQDSALFDETMQDNILLSRPDASEAQLAVAADAAFVTEFSEKMPLGLKTPAGPRGSNLSGGQRQRVAIARAILRDSPILLMDEPTSALDAQSEAAVQKALDGLSDGRTTLVIAHRLATILHADKIIVMDKGRVVDHGTHKELLSRGGLYASLYKLQFSD